MVYTQIEADKDFNKTWHKVALGKLMIQKSSALVAGGKVSDGDVITYCVKVPAA